MDIAERKRVEALLAAERHRPHLKEGRISQAKCRADRKRRTGQFVFVGTRLGYSSSHAFGDAIRASIVSSIEHGLNHGAGVAHVKNGKPLTAHGAQLLGLPWPVEGACESTPC